MVSNEFVTDFLVRANLDWFWLKNDFFSEQCRLITNDSSFRNNQIIETVTRINIDTDTIVKLIRSLDPNKAYGCDGILIRTLKLCATSIHNLYIFFLIIV